MTSVAPRVFRFRPRFRGVAFTAIGIGGSLAIGGLVGIGLVASAPLVTGIAGLVIGGAYFASPLWRLAVAVDADGLAVVGRGHTRFRLAWSDIVRVWASPSTRTCFVDGGDPARSLMVPGDGAPAPYAIERRAELYDLILAGVDPAVVKEVETIETAKARGW